MEQLFNQYLPNLMTYKEEFIKAILQTLEMVLKSGVLSLICGLILGITLVVTRKDGLLENRFVYHILDKVTNLFRSIPFVILITTILPLTRLIVGTSIGVKGAIFPLVIGCTPFFMRQVDMALSDTDAGLIEAAQAMGLSPTKIILRVYLRESIPALVRSITITLISLVGLTAMAGIVGGGGLGDFVTRYGHARYYYDITIVSVIVILLMVTFIQAIGNIIIRKTTH
ncbi:ABC transporter permease [Erysipelothrix sp. HDW6C]|uniref:methionine ABC transporter permease n=1 Tax=Erysipelothrix sp. HDW6C TaxID=2714930 RepID=UPI00140DBF51|nr:methionine ABC transporter permease [Erysipelothrix sp. HDW6C]QIK69484.1 ABC transporter permease [Erysipelothrix sp. HDW6C]